jgi:hypothetical protein
VEGEGCPRRKVPAECLSSGSARHRRLATILANLDTVAKGARRSWEIDGKYASTKKKRYVELSAKPPGK